MTLKVVSNPNTHDKQAYQVLTGKLDYSADVLPGKKLETAILHSPHAHARIVSIDTSQAEAMEGVRAVCTYKDCPVFKQNLTYWGQEVAAVAADSQDIAERAVEKIVVEYEVLPAVIDPDEAMKPGAPNVGVWPEGNVRTTELLRGDVETGLAEADITVSDTVGWSQIFQHSEIETHTATCWWIGDELYVRTTSQNPYSQAVQLGMFLGMPQNKVHLISHGSGTGHGDKHTIQWGVVAAVLAKKAGEPVLFRRSRKGQYLDAIRQHRAKADITIGLKNDGTITAIDAKFYGDDGGNGAAWAGGLSFDLRYTFKSPHGRFVAYDIATNTNPTGPWRCVADPPGDFLMSVVLDQAAEAVGMNPLEFRLKNLVSADEPAQDTGMPFSSLGMRECFEKAAEAIDYEAKWHAPGARTLGDGRLHGIGISGHIDSHGQLATPVSGIVNITRDGTVFISCGISRAGGGSNSAMCHIVAEVLGLPYDKVNTGDWGNIDVCPDGGMQGGSTRVITLGAAFYEAAMDARTQLLERAAGVLEVSGPDALDIENGEVYVKADPTKRRTFAQLCSSGTYPTIVGRGYTWEKKLRRPVGSWDVGEPCEVRGQCASAVEIAVDPETGEIEVLNFTNAIDMGRPAFYQGTLKQIEGGIELQIGQTLFYEQIFEKTNQDVFGATINASYLEHKWPTSADLPTEKYQPIIVETDDACGPFGCKGIGEPCLSSIGAMSCAFYNATGVWIKEQPITPMRVLKALGKA